CAVAPVEPVVLQRHRCLGGRRYPPVDACQLLQLSCHAAARLSQTRPLANCIKFSTCQTENLMQFDKRGGSDGFEDRRQSLPDADAHGRDAVAATAAAQLADQGGGEAGAGAAERVAEGDRSPVDVELLFVDS